MRKKSKKEAAAQGCPCGSGLSLQACCGRFLTGGAEPFGAPTPEALMRSRFTAFALGDEAYLLGTWAEETAHGETRGRVRFLAKARSSAGVVRLSENSFFRREPDGRWVYVSGEVEDD